MAVPKNLLSKLKKLSKVLYKLTTNLLNYQLNLLMIYSPPHQKKIIIFFQICQLVAN